MRLLQTYPWHIAGVFFAKTILPVGRHITYTKVKISDIEFLLFSRRSQ